MEKNRYEYLGNGLTKLEEDGDDRTINLGRMTDRFVDHPALHTLQDKSAVGEAVSEANIYTL